MEPTPTGSRDGLWVVLAGFVAILVALWFVVGTFTTATDVTAVLGGVTTAIAGLGGAFFGVSLGQQGREKAEQARDEATKQKDIAQRRAELCAGRLSADAAQEVDRLVASEMSLRREAT